MIGKFPPLGVVAARECKLVHCWALRQLRGAGGAYRLLPGCHESPRARRQEQAPLATRPEAPAQRCREGVSLPPLPRVQSGAVWRGT